MIRTSDLELGVEAGCRDSPVVSSACAGANVVGRPAAAGLSSVGVGGSMSLMLFVGRLDAASSVVGSSCTGLSPYISSIVETMWKK